VIEACLEKVKAETVSDQKEMKGCLEEAGDLSEEGIKSKRGRVCSGAAGSP
jgi:hypothetical protein